MERRQWTTEDFEDLSWHDVHVHGFRLIENGGDTSSAELLLDIDFIHEWIKGEPYYSFVIAQASLQFHEVFDLKFSLDYAQVSAGMCPFSIAGIERELVTFPNGHTSYKWRLDVNWPVGQMEFQSRGFTQVLVGQAYTRQRQSLEPAQRNVVGAA